MRRAWLLVLICAAAACHRHSPSARGRPERCLLEGRVLDAGHAPFEGARVIALPGDGRRPGPPVTTSADGRFSMVLAVGFYTLHIRAPGFEDAWETVVLRESGVTQSREFVLEAAHDTRGPQ